MSGFARVKRTPIPSPSLTSAKLSTSDGRGLLNSSCELSFRKNFNMKFYTESLSYGDKMLCQSAFPIQFFCSALFYSSDAIPPPSE
jgi:hypothetical protein